MNKKIVYGIVGTLILFIILISIIPSENDIEQHLDELSTCMNKMTSSLELNSYESITQYSIECKAKIKDIIDSLEESDISDKEKENLIIILEALNSTIDATYYISKVGETISKEENLTEKDFTEIIHYLKLTNDTLSQALLKIEKIKNEDPEFYGEYKVWELEEYIKSIKNIIEDTLDIISQKAPALIEIKVTYYEPYPLAFYNTFYEQDEPDITFDIKNNKEEPVNVRMTSEYSGYSYPAITTISLNPGEEKVVNQTIQLDIDKIEKIKTKTKMLLHYKIEYQDENKEWITIDEQTYQIDVYPMDTMVWAIKDNKGNWISLDYYIAVFVTPKDEAIQNLLAIAKKYHPERSLAGYQCDVQYGRECTEEEWKEYTALQVKAIYDALQDLGMSYVSTTIAFGKDFVQKVKLPRETMETLSGNCIDGTILFASALEALGIRPYIVLIPGHAFLAWSATPDGKTLMALETTMVGSSSFEEALDEGIRELEENWENITDEDPWNGIIVDIYEARELGILPMK